MLFNSFPYQLLFLPVVVAVYSILRTRANQQAGQLWILASSLFFYGSARPFNLVLMAGSILFNWGVAKLIVSRRDVPAGKVALTVGVAANIAFLASFKYINFFTLAIAALHGPKFALPDWEFPLGISFFTLTQIMYLVDTYQGLNGANTLFEHATFVSFFPYVISGPITPSRVFVPQLKKMTLNETRLQVGSRGVLLFALGLAKKVIFADSFARVADVGFGAIRSFSTFEAWIFCFAYVFQIYFDFSGYSDMAMGSAWMLGIDIPRNFNAPYRSKSISEFWQRWHISLSKFITNYLYTPILRSMGKATIRTSAIATLIAMGIAGLWHGPAWTYVIFGLIHGVALAINQTFKRRKLKLPDWLAWALTFATVTLAFIFFRSPDVPFALHFLRTLSSAGQVFGTTALRGVGLRFMFPQLIVGVVLAFFFKTSQEVAQEFRPTTVMALATAALLIVAWGFMDSGSAKQFVYFGF